MPIIANAARLKSRLRQIQNATRLAPYALSTVATQTLGDVRDNAVQRLAGREDQVGFDLPQFLENIRVPGPLSVDGARGTVGILHEPTMGTLEDFEEIGNTPGTGETTHLWHQGTGAGSEFKRRVFDYPDLREELALDRQQVWGAKTPQWYLMENGYSGTGAYPPVPASHFIASATRADQMVLRLRNAMTSLYKGIPRR